MPRAKKIKLGKKYRDTVTGFEGTATSRHEYLNGCVRFGLEAMVKEPGTKPAIMTFDEPQLEELSGKRPAASGAPGGPHPEPDARLEG